MKKLLTALALVALATPAQSLAAKNLRGDVKIDGSSTVFPITEAIAEEYRSEQPRVRVTIGVSGTGGGFKKFLNNEIDINNASRKIKGKEKKLATKKGISYLELPVAFDGITVIINKKNDWAKSITTKELKKIWQPGSQVKTWKDVRSTWPDKPIALFGPGTDSGTFDYFTKVINGKSHTSRSNYTKSEDDNILVKGVSGNKYALGYLGYAYYAENKAVLKSLPVDNGNGPVAANLKTINSGKYAPLSRPIFIYVNKAAAQKPQAFNFVNFYLEKAGSLVTEVGYVPLTEKMYKTAIKDFKTFSKK